MIVATIAVASAFGGVPAGGGKSRKPTPGARAADWRPLLTALLDAEPASAGPLLDAVVAADPPLAELAAALATWQPTAPPVDDQTANDGAAGDTGRTGASRSDRLHCLYLDFADSGARPWVLGIPAGYRPVQPTPLLVVLHGGVEGRAVAPDELRRWAADHPCWALARARGWAMLFPLGQDGHAWWEAKGIAMVHAMVIEAKRRLNIDDDRVWLAGISDGASGVFAQAMLTPTPYAAGVAINGHAGLANIDGELPTYLPNLANLPLFVTNGDTDDLYPTAKMAPIIAEAVRAGARIDYRPHPGGHAPPTDPAFWQAVGDFLAGHRRDPAARAVQFETADPEGFGTCRWLTIARLAPVAAADWHRDANVIVTADRVDFSFVYDDTWKGPGVGVLRVFPDTLAARLGLQRGDVVTAIDGQPVRTRADFEARRALLRRGNPLTVTVTRQHRPHELHARTPEPRYAWLFRRDAPSAMVRARIDDGGSITLHTSRVAELRLRVPPAWLQAGAPLTVTVDAEPARVFSPCPDLRRLLTRVLATRDRRDLVAAELTLTPIASGSATDR